MASEVKATAKPWDAWPSELPSAAERRAYPEYTKLTDESFQRELHAQIRARVFAESSKTFEAKSAAIVLQGGLTKDFEFYDTDTEKCPFRQESFFKYIFEINEPDCYGVLDLERKESLLFVPFSPDEAERWNGERRELAYYTKRYGVTNTYWSNQLHSVLQERKITTLHTLNGVNRDSGNSVTCKLEFPEIKQYTIEDAKAHPWLGELRTIKTPLEIEIMTIATLITSQAHVYVMRHVKSGMVELQCEALFKAWCGYFGASRHCAYTCICGSGAHGAILHYGHAGRPNDRVLQDGDTMVLDMGGEYAGYSTDVTRHVPVNGRFTDKQKVVHNAVVASQKAVLDAMKPGVQWTDMHRLAERVILEHLLAAGVLHNGTVADFEKAHIGSVFMPHGLGHMLGLDTHDTGGYEIGATKSKEPGLCYLRCGRELKEGMVITVEPGCYFNDKWLDRALANPEQAKYINAGVLAGYRGSGGCRLEDDVLVTATGIRNMTILPTTVEEIEAVMQRKA